jgi:adenosine deaminase
VLLIPVVMLVARRSKVSMVVVGIPALAGLSALHGEHAGHAHGVGSEEVELSMENLKAELEELGLSLDDSDDADGADDAADK